MSAFSEILHEPQVQRWAMALMHFLWQGCFIVVTTSIMLRMLREAVPTTRYATCLFAFAALTAGPFLTFMAIRPPEKAAAPKSLPRMHSTDEIVAAPIVATVVSSIDTRLADTTPLVVSRTSFDGPWEMARTWLVAIWFLGELLLGTWLLAGMVSLRVVRRSATPAPRELANVVLRLSHKMGLSKAPPVLCASAARDAASIGFFRPWILIPSAWIAQMTPEMLEAVLAHELMHIRRHDLWVNLFQRLAEVVLFFHPAVWWLSRRVREERELCCDAAAVQVTVKRKVYAQTLAYAARQRAAESFLGLASNLGDDRMSLLNRVRFVLREKPSAARSGWWPAGVAALLVPVILTFGLPHVASMADEKSKVAESVPDEEATIAEVVEVPIASQSTDRPPAPEEVVKPTQLRMVNRPSQAPSELNKVTLSDYVIEPPDILLIEGIRVVPKAPYKIQSQDVLTIVVLGTTPDRPIAGQFSVAASGSIHLGPGYGLVKVAGLTTEEASKAIRAILLRDLSVPEVAVSLFQASSQQVITGEHLVAPDGTVNLGIYGRVYVAGMTIEAGRAAIEKQLEPHFEKPKVSLDVFAYNSKFFYIINEGVVGGSVTRIPVHGNETVLDAIALIGGLDQPSERKLWISRPASSGVATDQVLPIDWQAITRGAKTSTNYQLLPGDRLFVTEPFNAKRSAVDSANAKQIESQLDQYNRFIGEWRIDEAVEFAQAFKKAHHQSEIARLIEHHAQLLQALQLEDELATGRFDLWRERKTTELEVRNRLRRKITVQFDDTPLSEVLEEIGKQSDLDIITETQGLAAEGITSDTPISIKLNQKISAQSALNLILDPLRLAFEVRESFVRITSRMAIRNLAKRTYNVSDLLSHQSTSMSETDLGTRHGPSDKLDYDTLMELITNTIAPDSWDEFGGPGSMVPFRGRLIVSQTPEVHAELAEFLRQLRRL